MKKYHKPTDLLTHQGDEVGTGAHHWCLDGSGWHHHIVFNGGSGETKVQPTEKWYSIMCVFVCVSQPGCLYSIIRGCNVVMGLHQHHMCKHSATI